MAITLTVQEQLIQAREAVANLKVALGYAEFPEEVFPLEAKLRTKAMDTELAAIALAIMQENFDEFLRKLEE